MANRGAGGATDLPNATQLAVDRTRLAYERTLMAWVRTATSLISFGFTIYKFFQFLREDDAGKMSHANHLIGPRQFALFLWGGFLWRMSRLDLRLIPAHPDHAAGLQFVGYSLRAFSLLGMALGAVAAGMVTNRVVYAGVPLSAYTHFMVALVACVVLLFSGPLLVFTGKLFHAKWRGTFEYGSLATGAGGQFERKWFKRPESIDESMLAAPDFSATTDLYQVVANVYDMGIMPLDLRNVLLVIVATLLPFVPVAFMAMPLDAILAQVAGLLL